MKKFMPLLLVAMLSGCATTVPAVPVEDREEINPHHSNAKKIGAFATGAIVANAIARKTGAGQVMSYVVGLLGGLVGVDLVKGSEWRPGDDEVEIIDVPAVGYSSGYSSCGAVSVYCDTTPKQGMYPPRPGMCNDPDSGGEATYEDLVRRAQRRAGCYDNNSGYRAPHPQQHASYAPAQVVYPPNLWERPEKRQKTEAKKSAGPVVGPTVGNYRYEPMIHPDCKTGNYGADGACLERLVDGLVLEQKACNSAGKKVVDGKTATTTRCPDGYNPGKWAGIYKRLSNDLSLRQKEEQGSEIEIK